MTETTPIVSRERGLDKLDRERILQILGPSGPLADSLPGFEYRQSQQEMAGAIADVFRDGGELLVEAGTGTGKTLAYLIPAVLSGQRVVISTGTKNLQEQLFEKDVPLLRQALGVPFSACLMKGRGNYLCLTRHARFTMQPSFRLFEQAHHFDTVTRWAETTKTGDRAEIPGAPDRLDFWKTISARSENCTGRECPEFDRCYVTKLRQRAAESEILIVNHHLLFADLMVREGSYGEVIPEYDYVVIDEAHQIEDVATQYFGVSVSTVRVDELARDIEAAWDERSTGRHLSQAKLDLRRLRNASQTLFELFRSKDERYRITPKTVTPAHERSQRSFVKQLGKVQQSLAAIPNPDEATTALSRRAGEIEIELDAILTAQDPETVSWCETRDRSLALRASPIHIAPMLRNTLFAHKQAIVMTSATLAVEGSFDYISDRIGIGSDRSELLASPFDYDQQAMLYVPRHLPQPRDGGYIERAVAEIRALLDASRGRAFVLFTSFQNLNAVRGALDGDLPFPLLVQGDAPRTELLDAFKATEGAVLLATSSFWEGVDVMGESLSLVIIDKLPFAVPSDPLIAARIDLLNESGGQAFADYQVPMAVLSLKQGLGRLIRSRTDRGVVAVLDSRIANMSYGDTFIRSLPPYRLTHDRKDVGLFFASGEPPPVRVVEM